MRQTLYILLMQCLIFPVSYAAEQKNRLEKSFEQSYVEMQKKLEGLKQKGEKLSDKSQKEIDDLMNQMNHEHTQLKRELEKKNADLNKKVSDGRSVVTEDWVVRAKTAFSELGAGLERAWNALSKPPEKKEDDQL